MATGVPRKSARQGEILAARKRQYWAAALAGPGLVWLALFLIIPLLLIVTVSFLRRGVYGQLEFFFSAESYLRLFGFGQKEFDPIYFSIFARSFGLGLLTSAACLACGWPVAFALARLPQRWKGAGLTLVTIPIWVNLLVRTYAWQIVLAPESWIVRMATGAGWLPSGASLYPGWPAVLVGMICDFLPFFVLPFYVSVEKMDWAIVEAAMDLGAGRRGILQHAILPQVRPGLVAGVVLVFLPSAGQFVVPDLLGGAKTFLLGNAIQQQFGASRDWPFGSALTVITLAAVALGLWAYALAAGKSKGPELV